MTPQIVDVSKMRQRVSLQQLSTTVSSVGQPLKDWTDVGTYWAEVITESGDETINANQLKAVLNSTITMRQLGISGPNIVPDTYRFVFNGRILNIRSVIALDNLNIYWKVSCSELVGGG